MPKIPTYSERMVDPRPLPANGIGTSGAPALQQATQQGSAALQRASAELVQQQEEARSTALVGQVAGFSAQLNEMYASERDDGQHGYLLATGKDALDRGDKTVERISAEVDRMASEIPREADRVAFLARYGRPMITKAQIETGRHASAQIKQEALTNVQLDDQMRVREAVRSGQAIETVGQFREFRASMRQDEAALEPLYRAVGRSDAEIAEVFRARRSAALETVIGALAVDETKASMAADLYELHKDEIEPSKHAALERTLKVGKRSYEAGTLVGEWYAGVVGQPTLEQERSIDEKLTALEESGSPLAVRAGELVRARRVRQNAARNRDQQAAQEQYNRVLSQNGGDYGDPALVPLLRRLSPSNQAAEMKRRADVNAKAREAHGALWIHRFYDQQPVFGDQPILDDDGKVAGYEIIGYEPRPVEDQVTQDIETPFRQGILTQSQFDYLRKRQSDDRERQQSGALGGTGVVGSSQQSFTQMFNDMLTLWGAGDDLGIDFPKKSREKSAEVAYLRQKGMEMIQQAEYEKAARDPKSKGTLDDSEMRAVLAKLFVPVRRRDFGSDETWPMGMVGYDGDDTFYFEAGGLVGLDRYGVGAYDTLENFIRSEGLVAPNMGDDDVQTNVEEFALAVATDSPWPSEGRNIVPQYQQHYAELRKEARQTQAQQDRRLIERVVSIKDEFDETAVPEQDAAMIVEGFRKRYGRPPNADEVKNIYLDAQKTAAGRPAKALPIPVPHASTPAQVLDPGPKSPLGQPGKGK